MDTAVQQEWFTLAEVGIKLRLSKRHVERLIANGELESLKFGPRLRRVSQRAIDSYLRSVGP